MHAELQTVEANKKQKMHKQRCWGDIFGFIWPGVPNK